MKLHACSLLFIYTTAIGFAAPVPLFDGSSFARWEGDTKKTWRIEEGAIIGGSLKENVPHNEFLCTTEEFENFELRLKFKLVGKEGFVNAGVQFRSKRIPNHFEVSGYQADLGDGYWGALYDESRRNKVLVMPDKEVVAKVLRKDDWNEYVIRCEGARIQLWINGTQTVEYTERDATIPRRGVIGLQIHGGGKAEARYKDLAIEVLPGG